MILRLLCDNGPDEKHAQTTLISEKTCSLRIVSSVYNKNNVNKYSILDSYRYGMVCYVFRPRRNVHPIQSPSFVSPQNQKSQRASIDTEVL